MTLPPVRGRAMTLFAVGVLLLDGVLLFLVGLWGRSAGFLLSGATCLVAALAVTVYWRRHRRTLAELAEARREVQSEARALRDLIRREP